MACVSHILVYILKLLTNIFAWEPSPIKTIRSGIKPLWILWNILLYIATPFLLRK